MAISQSRVQQFVEEYTSFKVEAITETGAIVRRYPDVPYELGAKEIPETIQSAIIREPGNWSGGALKSTSAIESWMWGSKVNRMKTGVDCSGFVYYVLNEASRGAVMNQFGVSYANGVQATRLAGSGYGRIVSKAKDITPGCTIRTNGGTHVLVVYDVDKNTAGEVTRIRYAHSNPDHGPHKAYVNIGDENQDLNGSAQTWVDSGYTNAVYLKNNYNYTILLDSLV